jgi:hypothetical protein
VLVYGLAEDPVVAVRCERDVMLRCQLYAAGHNVIRQAPGSSTSSKAALEIVAANKCQLKNAEAAGQQQHKQQQVSST